MLGGIPPHNLFGFSPPRMLSRIGAKETHLLCDQPFRPVPGVQRQELHAVGVRRSEPLLLQPGSKVVDAFLDFPAPNRKVQVGQLLRVGRWMLSFLHGLDVVNNLEGKHHHPCNTLCNKTSAPKLPARLHQHLPTNHQEHTLLRTFATYPDPKHNNTDCDKQIWRSLMDTPARARLRVMNGSWSARPGSDAKTSRGPVQRLFAMPLNTLVAPDLDR